MVQWICPKHFPGDGEDIASVVFDEILENRASRHADVGVLYDPHSHDSSAFSYSMSTQPGDRLLPAHELVGYVKEALDVLDALRKERNISTMGVEEPRMYWYSHLRTRAAMDSLNVTTMKENLASLRDALQDKRGVYARRDAMLEGDDPTSEAVSKRLQASKDFLKQYTPGNKKILDERERAERAYPRMAEAKTEAPWVKYLETDKWAGREMSKLNEADVENLRDLLTAFPEKLREKTPGLGHTAFNLLHSKWFQDVERKRGHAYHIHAENLRKFLDRLGKELGVPDKEEVEVHGLYGVRYPVRHANTASASNLHVVVNLTGEEGVEAGARAWRDSTNELTWKDDAKPSVYLNDDVAPMGVPVVFPAHFAFTTGRQPVDGVKVLITFGKRVVSEALTGGKIYRARDVRRELSLDADWAERAATSWTADYHALAPDATWSRAAPWESSMFHAKEDVQRRNSTTRQRTQATGPATTPHKRPQAKEPATTPRKRPQAKKPRKRARRSSSSSGSSNRDKATDADLSADTETDEEVVDLSAGPNASRDRDLRTAAREAKRRNDIEHEKRLAEHAAKRQALGGKAPLSSDDELTP